MKFSFKILAAFFLLMYIVSCKRQIESPSEPGISIKDISEIAQDTTFINFLKDQLNYSLIKKNTKKINEILKNQTISSEEMKTIHNYFGFNNPIDFLNHFNEMKRRALYLDKVFGLNRMEISAKRDILINGFERLLKKINTKNEGTISRALADGPCETARVNCIVTVTSESAIMHLGCAALDLTVLGGLLCHGAAVAYQWSAGNTCNSNYQLCVNQRIN